MNRYFIEVAYKGTRYAGFQIQKNAVTVQEEIEKALGILLREEVKLTGSSRTDAGVHALQNYFHFDYEGEITQRALYNINSILPQDIAVPSVKKMKAGSHCRFDAIARHYRYDIYTGKNPFLQEYACYFPYEVHRLKLQEMAETIIGEHDFTVFSKRNTQVKTYICHIYRSFWVEKEGQLSYYVQGNRFLRGMVRGLTGTMLKLARRGEGAEAFKNIMMGGDNRVADFSVPGKGLWLEKVVFPEGYFEGEEK